jgi:hypothetical protein
MRQGLNRYIGFIVSAVLFLLLASGLVIFLPKVFFVMHPAEISLSVYGGSRLFPIPVIQVPAGRVIPSLPNTYIINSPAVSKSGGFEAGIVGRMQPLSYPLGRVAETIAALHPGKAVLLCPSDIQAGEMEGASLKNYEKACSTYERDAMLKSLTDLGAEAVVVPFPQDTEVLFDDPSLIFYLPLSFKSYYSGTNILYFEPDMESLEKALVKGNFLRIETRISEGSL